MTIRRVMKSDLIVATPQMPLKQAVQLLIDHRISGMPVVDDDRHIVGVISEMDLIATLGEPHRTFRTVADVMTSNPVSIGVDEDLVRVYDVLMTHTFRRVLIHDGNKLVGLVSRADLIPIILEGLGD